MEQNIGNLLINNSEETSDDPNILQEIIKNDSPIKQPEIITTNEQLSKIISNKQPEIVTSNEQLSKIVSNKQPENIKQISIVNEVPKIKVPKGKIVTFKNENKENNEEKNIDFYSLFGHDISKTSVYLIVIFIILTVGYYGWNYYKNKQKI